MKFFKTHALGNDFIIVETKELVGDPGEVARQICHRHFGAGADGLIVVNEEKDGFAFRIFNADGSEAEISGNGIRCAAAYLYYTGKAMNKEIHFNTKVGIRRVWLAKKDENTFFLKVSMGTPRLKSTDIPFDDGTERNSVIDYPLSIGNNVYHITAVSVGNPHCVLFFENLPSSLEWKEIGKEIEEHPFFPERTNVEFVKVIDNSTIEVLFWERGVGETYSSGSGSCAAAYVARLKGFVGNEILVKTPAGDIKVHIKNDEISVLGPAEVIYKGEWLK